MTGVVDALTPALGEAQIAIQDILRVEDGRYWSYLCQNPHCCPPEGSPYDPSDHPAAQALSAAGLEPRTSRADLAATLARAPESIEPIAQAMERQIALRQTAHEVERRITSGDSIASPGQEPAGPQKLRKILILITANPKTAMLIRRAKRVSDFMGAEAFAIAIQPTGDLTGLPEAERQAVEQHLNFARNLHIETRILEGEDVAEVLVDFARRNQITQIYLTRPREQSWLPLLNRDPAQKIISLAKDMQIVIVSDREQMADR